MLACRKHDVLGGKIVVLWSAGVYDASMNSVRLGPFIVMQKVVSDESCQTWRGVHPGRSLPVWVSIDGEARQWEPRQLSQFTRLMRGVHRLSHPTIRRSFAYGVVETSVAEQLGDSSLAGRPYWVWEAPPRSSQGGLNVSHGWSRLRLQLMNLLDGFAHAHAREMLHLGRLRDYIRHHEEWVYLHGFGFPAARLRSGRSAHTGCAPELQPITSYRVGPWTDLYHLGVLLRELLEAASHVPSQVEANGTQALVVPEGFGDWLDRMTAVEPLERFRTAADAARALQHLDASKDDVDWRRAQSFRR